MPIWPDVKTAEDHLTDLKKVRESLSEANSNEYRIKLVDKLIKDTEAEAKATPTKQGTVYRWKKNHGYGSAVQVTH